MLNLSPIIISDTNDENKFPHKLLLTDIHVSRLCKAFPNGSLANTKLSKTQLHKVGQTGVGPLLKTFCL